MLNNKFHQFNQVPIELRIEAMKRLLGEPDAKYSEDLKKSSYTLDVFWKEIENRYFEQSFMKRYEEALCIPSRVPDLRENFPAIASCLIVTKAPREEGGRGRPSTKKQDYEYALDLKRLQVSRSLFISIYIYRVYS